METPTLPTTRSSGSKTIRGRFPNSHIEQKVAEWVRFCLLTKHDPPLSKPLTIHLNALLDMEIDRQDVLAVSFESYRALIEQMVLLGISEAIMPSLYVPLGLSETLMTGPYDAEVLIRQINYNEPPSLYLTERSLKTKLRALERYDFPLSSSGFFQDNADIYVYYSTWRTLEDIENGWEYGRVLVAEYYPKAHQNTP